MVEFPFYESVDLTTSLQLRGQIIVPLLIVLVTLSDKAGAEDELEVPILTQKLEGQVKEMVAEEQGLT